jgi:hypothetical protein
LAAVSLIIRFPSFVEKPWRRVLSPDFRNLRSLKPQSSNSL